MRCTCACVSLRFACVLVMGWGWVAGFSICGCRILLLLVSVVCTYVELILSACFSG